MNKPEDMFEILREDSEVLREDGTSWRKTSYYLIYKPTGEKHFAKTRPYGYSGMIDCKRARTRIFNDYMKSLEENLLGKEVR